MIGPKEILVTTQKYLRAVQPEAVAADRDMVRCGLRLTRGELDIGLREMARRIGADPSNLCAFERGRAWSDKLAADYFAALEKEV